MSNKLSPEEIEKRFAEINSQPAETLSDKDEEALKEAMAINDGSTAELKAYMAELEGYSGRLVLRLPRSLHKSLKEKAAVEGVSLNQYLIYKLAL